MVQISDGYLLQAGRFTKTKHGKETLLPLEISCHNGAAPASNLAQKDPS